MKKIFLFIFPILSILIIACNEYAQTPLLDEGYLTGAEEAQIYYRVIGSGQDSVVVIHGGPGAGMHSVLLSLHVY